MDEIKNPMQSRPSPQPANRQPPAITFDQIVKGFTGEEPFEAYVKRFFKERGIDPRHTPNFKKLDPAIQWLYRVGSARSAFKHATRDLNDQFAVSTRVSGLLKRCRTGDLNSLCQLLAEAVYMTRGLNDLGKEFPNFVSIIARGCFNWPVLAKLHREGYREDFDYLRSIRLDEWRSPGMALASRRDNDQLVPAARWAIKLIRKLDSWRLLPQGRGIVPKAHDHRSDAELALTEKGVGLKPFDKSTALEWWELAKPLFLIMTKNRPWEIEELESYAGNEEEDSIKRKEIVKLVKQAFTGLAPNNPHTVFDDLLRGFQRKRVPIPF